MIIIATIFLLVGAALGFGLSGLIANRTMNRIERQAWSDARRHYTTTK